MSCTRSKKTFELTKAELLQRLGISNPEAGSVEAIATRNTLALEALRQEKVSEQEYEASLIRKHTTVKCYWRTLVEDEDVRRAIEGYVSDFSLASTRTFALLNFMARDCIYGSPTKPYIVLQGENLMWKVPTPGSHDNELVELYNDLFIGQTPTLIRQAFNYDRFDNKQSLHSRLAASLSRYTSYVHHLRPTHFPPTEFATAWDSASSTAAQRIKQNLALHVRSAASRGAIKYIELLGTEDTEASLKLLLAPLPKMEEPEALTGDTISHVKDIRRILGQGDDDRLSKYPKLTIDLFSFYVHLHRTGVLESSLMPQSQIGRKYAYIDGRVLRSLLPGKYKTFKTSKGEEATDQGFMLWLGISGQTLMKRRKESPRQQRKTARRRLARRARKQKKRQGRGLEAAWGAQSEILLPHIMTRAKRGCSSLKKGVRLLSVSTDAVGASLLFYIPPKRPLTFEEVANLPKTKQARKNRKLKAAHLEDQEKAYDPLFLGLDPGIAKLHTTAFTSKEPDPELRVKAANRVKTLALTRKTYKFYSGDETEEKRRIQREAGLEDLQRALTALSTAGSTHDLRTYYAAQRDSFIALKTHRVDSPEDALARMRLTRRKRSVLDREAHRIFRRAREVTEPGSPKETMKKSRMVLGIGAAKMNQFFTSRGGVPTSKFPEALHRAKKRLNTTRGFTEENGPMTILYIDECRTSQNCFKCWSRTESVFVRDRPPKKVPRKVLGGHFTV